MPSIFLLKIFVFLSEFKEVTFSTNTQAVPDNNYSLDFSATVFNIENNVYSKNFYMIFGVYNERFFKNNQPMLIVTDISFLNNITYLKSIKFQFEKFIQIGQFNNYTDFFKNKNREVNLLMDNKIYPDFFAFDCDFTESKNEEKHHLFFGFALNLKKGITLKEFSQHKKINLSIIIHGQEFKGNFIGPEFQKTIVEKNLVDSAYENKSHVYFAVLKNKSYYPLTAKKSGKQSEIRSKRIYQLINLKSLAKKPERLNSFFDSILSIDPLLKSFKKEKFLCYISFILQYERYHSASKNKKQILTQLIKDIEGFKLNSDFQKFDSSISCSNEQVKFSNKNISNINVAIVVVIIIFLGLLVVALMVFLIEIRMKKHKESRLSYKNENEESVKEEVILDE